MAGIFSDVSTDIQKLRQLKAEIENVKKSLKGIDVNVNVDIAKGMKAQLQSLMKQYDALVKKVSEAEGKIIISTKRINDASEKIIKAQEQLSKAAGMNTQPSNGNADVSLNNMGTTSVRAQAKAYNELAEEIDSVMGTRSQNIKRMIDEQNAIRLINEEIKGLAKLQIGNSTLTSTQQKRLEQLNNSLLTHKAALSEVRQTLMNNVRLDNAATTSMNGLSQSLSRMRIAYRELTEEERNSPFGKELLASIQQADAKIKELDATIGNHQRNVGNYAKGYNGLNMSVQQIVRELPSAAMGLNTFFLAISNNLPILTDEIKRAKTANEELKTSGQSTIPIWKQLVTSFFSWQTALTTGIMLLVMYGDEIVDWVKGLFTAKDALENTRKAQEEFNAYISKLNEDWRNSVATTAGENIAAYQRLVREYNALGDNMNAKKKFITDNQDAFHELGFSVNGVTDAENLFVRNTDAVVNALVARAKAAAYEQEITDATQRYIKQTEYNNSTVSGGGYYKTIHAGQNWTSTGIVPEELRNLKKGVDYTTISSQTVVSFTLTAAGAARINAQRSREAANRLKRNNEEAKRQLDSVVSRATEGIRQQTDAEQTVYNSLGIKSYAPQSSKKQVKTKNQVLNRAEAIRKQTETLRNLEKRQSLDRKRDAVDLENQVEQARIDTLADGGEKVAAQQALNNRKEMQAIDRAKEEYIQKEIQRQKEIFDATEELKAKKNPKYKKRSFDSSTVSVDTSSFGKLKDFTEQKQLQDRLKAEKEAMNSYLVEYGSYMQKRQAIIEQYQNKINRATTEGEKLTLGKQRDKILSDLDEQANKTTSAISQLFGDMKDKTLKDLEAINTAGQEALEFLKSGQWDEQKGKELGITKENFEIWSNDPEKIKAITDALLKNKKAAEELRPAYDKVADGLKRIFNSGNDTKKLDEALNDLRNGLSEILQVGSFLSDTFSSLGESFGANAFSGIAEGINVAMDSLNSAMQGAEAGSIFGPVGSAVGATVGFVSSISSAFAKIHDKKNEKQIQKLQKQIDVLTESYDKLGESVEKAYSKDASELIGQQNEMLEQQKVLIEQQIKEEKDKKDTDKKRIEEWENQIDEINDAIKDNKEKAVDAIFGEDLKTAIENFSSAYADAWSNGEDRAESAKETVKSMMRQMVTESIKSAIQASGSMEKIRQKLQEFYADNVLSGWEQDYIYNMAEEIQKELDKQFGWADDLFEEDSSKQQSASSRGFETMSQDTADELNGRFTALYESGLRIETAEQQQTVAITALQGSVTALTVQQSGLLNIADETRTILANSYLELQQIRENTGEIVKPIKQIQADIAEVKRNTSRL